MGNERSYLTGGDAANDDNDDPDNGASGSDAPEDDNSEEPSGDVESSEEDEEAGSRAEYEDFEQAMRDHFRLGPDDIFVDHDGLLYFAAPGNKIVDNLEEEMIKWRTHKIDWSRELGEDFDQTKTLYVDTLGRFTDESGERIIWVDDHIYKHHISRIIHKSDEYDDIYTNRAGEDERWISTRRRRRRAAAIKRGEQPASDTTSPSGSFRSSQSTPDPNNMSPTPSPSPSPPTPPPPSSSQLSTLPERTPASPTPVPAGPPPTGPAHKGPGRGRGRGGRGRRGGRGQHTPAGLLPPGPGAGRGRGRGRSRGRGRGRRGPKDLHIQPPPYRRGIPNWGDRAYRPGR